MVAHAHSRTIEPGGHHVQPAVVDGQRLQGTFAKLAGWQPAAHNLCEQACGPAAAMKWGSTSLLGLSGGRPGADIDRDGPGARASPLPCPRQITALYGLARMTWQSPYGECIGEYTAPSSDQFGAELSDLCAGGGVLVLEHASLALRLHRSAGGPG